MLGYSVGAPLVVLAKLQGACSITCACSVTGCLLSYRVRAQLLNRVRVSLQGVFGYMVGAQLQGVCLVTGCVLSYRVRVQLQGVYLLTGWVFIYVCVLSYRVRTQLLVRAELQGGCSAAGCVLAYRVGVYLFVLFLLRLRVRAQNKSERCSYVICEKGLCVRCNSSLR